MNAPKPPRDRSGVWIDYETGLIHCPDGVNRPLVGPTTGKAFQDLKAEDAKQRQVKLHMERQLRSVWGCTQCKRIFSALSPNPVRNILKRSPRVKWRKVDGVNCETLVCFDPRCDAPIVMLEDALSLTRAPGGNI